MWVRKEIFFPAAAVLAWFAVTAAAGISYVSRFLGSRGRRWH